MEIYLNGKLIRNFGTPSADANTEKAEIPLRNEHIVFQFDTTEFQRIDILYSSHKRVKNAGFNITVSSTKNAIGLLRFTALFFDGLTMLAVGTFVAFSLIHLLLFFFYKEDKSNLYYGLSTIAITIMLVLNVVARLMSNPNDVFVLSAFANCTGYVTIYFILRLFYYVFNGRTPVWHWFFLTLTVLAIGTEWHSTKAYSLIPTLYVILSLVEFLRITYKAIRHKLPGSKQFGFGILAALTGGVILLITLYLVYSVGIIKDEISGIAPFGYLGKSIAFLILISVPMAFYSIPVSMSLFISHKSAETNESLKIQLKKVEELSAETLRQEREKRKMLQGQKKMLETEVQRQTKEIREQHEIVKKERDRSEELLLNILPAETAKELKEKGHSDAQFIDQVTVIFTDFKGFTVMSEQLTPKELVQDLHACFSEFDRICTKYGIEKIKTIGDAYMAAGGLPVPNTTHAKDVAQAALEMAKVVEDGKAQKQAAGEPFFEIRIGIHTGPVVAGIVGVKKFAYDIWGDTVNTASRMESSGDVGKVNVSQSTYELLKDDPNFAFENRGKIESKGKGGIEMYFVSKT
jgi:class 3 adenylate cyclase